jgi:dihydropteroate synthase
MFSEKTLLNCRGRLLDLSTPKVMGILNVTPDSFYSGSRVMDDDDVLPRAEKMLREGAAIIDVGGMSTRPGAEEISEDEELHRVIPAVETIHRNFPDAVISIDTFRSRVAEEAAGAGAAIVNDISAGRSDEKLLPAVARLQMPYVLMHMQGTPQTMQQNPFYQDAVKDVFDFLKEKMIQLNRLGIYDIVADTGFGFGKSVEHNYDLLRNLHVFRSLGVPLMAGLSRKSMICKVLQVNPGQALSGTIALNAIALMNGAKLLRVHDVREAMHVIGVIAQLKKT